MSACATNWHLYRSLSIELVLYSFELSASIFKLELELRRARELMLMHPLAFAALFAQSGALGLECLHRLLRGT